MNYIFVGKFDVTQIKDKLIEMGEEIWLKHTLRQQIFDAHKHTQTVELIWDIDSLNTKVRGKIHPNFYKFNIDSLLVDLKPIYEKAKTAIEAVAATQGFDYVLDAMNGQGVLFANGKDLLADVKKQLGF